MRKYDVFGNKNRASQPLIILVIVFVLVVVSYTAILITYNSRISALEADNSEIQQQINTLLINEQSRSYAEVEELLPYLPNEFNQANIYNEVILMRDVSGLQSALNFDIDFIPDGSNPFDQNINNALKYVQINISFTINDIELVMDFINHMVDLDRIYYIQSTTVDILSNETIQTNITLYTFYIEG